MHSSTYHSFTKRSIETIDNLGKYSRSLPPFAKGSLREFQPSVGQGPG